MALKAVSLGRWALGWFGAAFREGSGGFEGVPGLLLGMPSFCCGVQLEDAHSTGLVFEFAF